MNEYSEIIPSRLFQAKIKVTPILLHWIFIKANVKHIFFVKLDSRYRKYFPEY